MQDFCHLILASQSLLSCLCLLSRFPLLSVERKRPLQGATHLICLRCLLQTAMNHSVMGGLRSLCFDFRKSLSNCFIASTQLIDDQNQGNWILSLPVIMMFLYRNGCFRGSSHAVTEIRHDMYLIRTRHTANLDYLIFCGWIGLIKSAGWSKPQSDRAQITFKGLHSPDYQCLQAYSHVQMQHNLRSCQGSRYFCSKRFFSERLSEEMHGISLDPEPLCDRFAWGRVNFLHSSQYGLFFVFALETALITQGCLGCC